jgi:pimeloyl-ACP methyl ester carboxylesterase
MKLHHRIIGQGSDIFIFHGLFGMSDNWQSFGRQLAESGHRVILADLRNHGHSPQATPHDYPSMAADIRELLHNLSAEQPVIIGHSMGGKAVMQFLCETPELVSKAIVVDIAPWRYPVHHREILDALLSIDLNTVKTRKAAEEILEQQIDDNGTRQFLLKNLYWKTPEQLDWRFNLHLLNQQIDEVGEPTWPSIQVTTPILFIKGENSGYIDPFRFNEIEQWYPNAELVEISNAGHWVHAENAGGLLKEVDRFLSY